MASVPRTGRHLLPELLRSPSMPTLLIIAALVIGAAALIPLVQSAVATSTNGNVHRLEQERADWQARTQELELEVATMASLDRIEKKARTELKMAEPKETRYIAVEAAAPEPRTLPSRYLPPKTDEKQAGPSIWEQLLDWLPLP
ncbi:MAG: cell division protein FtsL [Dehalococcoidia bacterium]|nr:cell division protein FtsL [Dehalococcoidia bacterium]